MFFFLGSTIHVPHTPTHPPTILFLPHPDTSLRNTLPPLTKLKCEKFNWFSIRQKYSIIETILGQSRILFGIQIKSKGKKHNKKQVFFIFTITMPLLATPSPCVFFFALLVDPDPTLYSTVIQRIIVRILFGSMWIVIDSGTIANQNNNVQFYCSETLQLLIRIFVFYETINCRSFASEPSIQSIYFPWLPVVSCHFRYAST